MRCYIEEVDAAGETIAEQTYFVKAANRDGFADTIARAIKEHASRFSLGDTTTRINVTLDLDDTAILVTK